MSPSLNKTTGEVNKMSKHKPLPLFTLLRIIRDAHSTRDAQRELLMALAMRCNPSKGYICWPSYAQLAEDTMLNQETLKRAAKKLEETKLIRRRKRPNHSNIFFINAPLLIQQAEERKEEKETAKRAAAGAGEAEAGSFVEIEGEKHDTDVLDADSHELYEEEDGGVA